MSSDTVPKIEVGRWENNRRKFNRILEKSLTGYQNTVRSGKERTPDKEIRREQTQRRHGVDKNNKPDKAKEREE